MVSAPRMFQQPIEVGFLVATLALPLSFQLDRQSAVAPAARRIAWLMPVLAVAAVHAVTRSAAGGLFAAVYVALAVALGLWRLSTALGRPVLEASELALAFAWVWAVGGGIWLFTYASGSLLLGFEGPWALLTGAHFHAAGFGAFTVTALLVRALQRGRALFGLHAVAFTCVALGLNGIRALEVVGTVFYLLLFASQLSLALRERVWRRRGGVWLLVPLSIPLSTLALAVDWALGPRHLTLEQMAWWHGVVNASGHVLLGLVAFARMAPAPRSRSLEAPLSNIRARGRLGAQFVERISAREPEPVTGLVPRFGDYRRDDFATDEVHPRIAHFYEHTADYGIEATQQWKPGFVMGGRIFAAAARWVGQMGLPGEGTPAGAMTNRLVDVDDEKDGRADVRAWVRTWRSTGHTLYVALYGEHLRDGIRYMNIAFPLPFASMVSILRFDALPEGAVSLSTLQRSPAVGDQGVYLRLFGARAWRLPLDETIEVEARDDGLVARHDMWIFGRLFLRLDYTMRPAS